MSPIRHADLLTLNRALKHQQTRKVDVVVSPRDVRAEGGHLIVRGAEPILTPDGVSEGNGVYLPTGLCDEGLAAKLAIPRAYLAKMREEAPELYDANVNGWLERTRADKRYLVRALRGDTGAGTARAFLSNGYKRIDNLDVLTAMLEGIREAGIDVTIDGCDLTERRMYVRVVCEQVRVMAPRLLGEYRSPFTGQLGADCPVVFAGFVLANSETGCGAFTIVPRLVVEICRNGMTIEKDVMRDVHLGGRLAEGVVTWSAETQQRGLALITSKARDAVTQFLDPDYVRSRVGELERQAGTPVSDPENTIAVLSNQLNFPEDHRTKILNHFIKGADLSAGGIMHAITATARDLDDADAAHDLEIKAPRAMTLAARM